MADWWIKRYSSRMREHWLWKEPALRLAWNDLMDLAVCEPTRRKAKDGTLVTLQPGQVLTSYRYLADLWKCSVSTAAARVEVFVKPEGDEPMVSASAERGQLLLTLLQWGTYQGADDDARTATGREPNGDRTGAERIEDLKIRRSDPDLPSEDPSLRTRAKPRASKPPKEPIVSGGPDGFVAKLIAMWEAAHPGQKQHWLPRHIAEACRMAQGDEAGFLADFGRFLADPRVAGSGHGIGFFNSARDRWAAPAPGRSLPPVMGRQSPPAQPIPFELRDYTRKGASG